MHAVAVGAGHLGVQALRRYAQNPAAGTCQIPAVRDRNGDVVRRSHRRRVRLDNPVIDGLSTVPGSAIASDHGSFGPIRVRTEGALRLDRRIVKRLRRCGEIVRLGSGVPHAREKPFTGRV